MLPCDVRSILNSTNLPQLQHKTASNATTRLAKSEFKLLSSVVRVESSNLHYDMRGLRSLALDSTRAAPCLVPRSLPCGQLCHIVRSLRLCYFLGSCRRAGQIPRYAYSGEARWE